jgi:UDP-N-acetylglucosamine--N-acetylmuramyl-(pentapeptide) pyrophosphoryl-undecaprenol N-acetylglucosamine transferase
VILPLDEHRENARKELKERFHDIEILWFGHKVTLSGTSSETLEYKEITSLGLRFFDLKAGKLYKTYNPLKLLKVPYGFIQALILLKKTRPEVILSFGGYLAAPVVLAGWFLGIPSVTHEQTVVVGYANRLISLLAKKIFYTWPQTLAYLPKERSIKTGLPLREEIFEVGEDEFNPKNRRPTIYITAGKTGSHIINMAIDKILPELLQQANVIHQTGEHSRFNDHEALKQTYDEIKTKVEGVYILRKFIYSDQIGSAYANASLVVSRAGAHTCYELLALEKPCILIPIMWASHNEQMKNALVVKQAGLGEVLEEDKIKDERYLLEVIKEMLENIEQYNSKEHLDKNLNAARIIVDETVKIL